MSARRDELVAAFELNDHAAIKAAGWWDIWEFANTGWASRDCSTAKGMVPYAKALGDQDPADVWEAFQECSGEWRPRPGQLKGFLNAKRGDSSRVDVGRGRDRSSTPEALTAVAEAIRRGEQACTCGPPTLRRWHYDSTYVLRCPEGHLEPGQVFAAEDAGLLKEAA